LELRDAVIDVEIEDTTVDWELGHVVVDLELGHAVVDLELGDEEAARSRARRGRERRPGSRSHAAVGVEEQVVGLSTSSFESPGLREDAEPPLQREGIAPASLRNPRRQSCSVIGGAELQR
jgi:hypothetical protein